MNTYKSTIVFIGILFISILIGAYYIDQKTQQAFFPKKNTEKSAQKAQTIPNDSFLQGSYTCTIVIDKNTTVTGYINHGVIRTDSLSSQNGQTISTLYKDSVVYIWNQSTMQGSSTQLPEILNQLSQAVEKYKNNCKPTDNFSNDLFTIPTNVNFTASKTNSPQQAAQNYLQLQQGK